MRYDRKLKQSSLQSVAKACQVNRDRLVSQYKLIVVVEPLRLAIFILAVLARHRRIDRLTHTEIGRAHV